MTKAVKRPVDWEAIEPDWRAGIKSVLQIAADYAKGSGVSVSHTAINKHFKKLGVPRDLSGKIRSKADAMVSAAMVSGRVSIETTAKDVEIIDTNATVLAHVQLAHRQDIQRYRNLTRNMLMELEQQTGNIELFEQLAEIMIDTGEDDSKAAAERMFKMKQAFDKAMSTAGRIDAMKKLSETLKVLIGLEREAFGIEGKPQQEDNPLMALLRQVSGTSLPVVHDVEGEVIDD